MARPDKEFVKRLYPVSALLTVLAYLCAWRWFGNEVAYGIVAGVIFGISNALIIAWLAKVTIFPGSRNPLSAATALVVKLPLVYGLLYVCFSHGWIKLTGFVAGLQVLVVALVICAILVHLDAHRTSETGESVKEGEAG